MIYIFIFILLIIFSAFFSGSETAYFHLRKHSKKTPKKILSILKHPRRLLVSILTGNTLANVAIASLAAYITHKYAQQHNWNESTLILIEVLIVSAIVLIFGEILPKMIAINRSKAFAERVYVPLKILMSFLYPVAQGFYKITNFIMELIPFRKEKIFDSEEELKILAEVGEEEGTLQEEESEMIQSIFDFTDKIVGEIITPRVDIVGLQSNENLDKAMDIIGEKQFSKIPIYKDSVDNIKTSIAIVVDEWGGTEGLVTLEDVVEEVIGEIRDPYDQEEIDVLKQPDGSFIVEGSVTIYDLEEETDIEFPEKRDYDTLAGFILETLTEIPSAGEYVKYNNNIFTVQTVQNNRIGKVKISQEV